ncbi:MAG: hypothetical protein EXR70_21955 [Deltaproteobacteria bacterium]|nr:hypothetical protein [Deltaproteobacteria bacterium]
MNRHLFQGIVAGTLFAIPIVWIAAMDAIAEGNALAILACTVFGVAAGLCIGSLIAANFAMLALEEKEPEVVHHRVDAHA